MPYQDGNGNEYYCLGDDPEERYMPSKLENPAKRKHGLPFSPTGQTAPNVGMTMNCTKSRKPRLIYGKSKLKRNEINELKRSLKNGFQYVSESSFQDISIDKRSSPILNKVFSRENISRESPMEQPYYSSKFFKMVCYHCARASALTNDSVNFPQYARCNNKPKVRIPKRKVVNQVDLTKNKKQKR